MDIGKKLMEYRLLVGQKKKRMQRECGVTSVTITNIEQGAVSPTFETLEKICDCLGLKIQLVDKSGNII